MFRKRVVFSLLGLLLIVLLSGCGADLAFTPEAAAIKSVTRPVMPDFKTDPNSVQILQKQPIGDKFMVLLTFQGIRANSGQETCLFSYIMTRSPLGGWSTGGGGGGCSNQKIDPETQPISIDSGSTTFGPTDPGYSNVDGQVFDPDVKMVQVSWTDGKVDQVKVINNSYLAVRTGQAGFQKVEALDEQGKVIYTNEPGVAPGKQ